MVREGYVFAAPPLLAGLALLALNRFVFGQATWLNWLAGISIFLGAFVLYFFRDPQRVIPEDPAAVVSPADGRVVEIVDEAWEGKPGRRISIFLSVWDVHIQRAPVAGTIRQVDYRPGKFYAALRARASVENEQNVIRIATPRGEMMFKQIAGWIARRVVSWKAAGDAVTRGERVGMIRFGSRVDVWLPPEAAIAVRKGQHVAGGSDILARWP
ncbi:MAG: phosphatidylserine decarboxylase family protein [Acidobacteria bacterium]|nr:phosphatidylserine decarboxylase family protein [Acidobacteriota bacterium]MBI3663747.1 phosphatidylserine decarboxylase family protein [Acidobacteriota bacterium]